MFPQITPPPGDDDDHGGDDDVVVVVDDGGYDDGNVMVVMMMIKVITIMICMRDLNVIKNPLFKVTPPLPQIYEDTYRGLASYYPTVLNDSALQQSLAVVARTHASNMAGYRTKVGGG